MTGYGKATAIFEGKKIVAELRSLNSKALDLTARVTNCYREREMEMRAKIQQCLVRGKVDFALWIERDADQDATPINGALVRHYYDQINRIAYEQDISLEMSWGTLLRMPDVMSRAEQTEVSDAEWVAVGATVDGAIAALTAFRQQEGAALERTFNGNIDRIEQLMRDIEPYEKSRVERVRQRLEENLSKLSVDYDANRLEQELIYYIEKLDINEEKQRLSNHLDYFRQTMAESDGGQGKKLGFIAQEIGREINTTGSKSNQAEMQNIVVMMKDELEQIKEQVLNVL